MKPGGEISVEALLAATPFAMTNAMLGETNIAVGSP